MNDNGKILSATRSAEDQDLVERSTKKTKVLSDVSGLSAMDIVEGSIAVSGDGVSTPLSEELMSETPSVAQTVVDSLDLASPVAMVPETQPEIEDERAVTEASTDAGDVVGQSREVHDPALVGEAAVHRPSYLDSVVGSGSNTAPFLIANNSETDDACPKLRQTEVQDEPAILEGEVHTNRVGRGMQPPVSFTAQCAAPYGPWMIATRKERPWMIATRKERRQVGRPGFRFAPLEPEVTVGEHAEEDNSMPPVNTNRRSDRQQMGKSSGPSLATMGVQNRRPNVIVSEKQIANDPSTPSPLITGTVPVSSRMSTSTSSRRAAEEDEHVVIRGENGGSLISSSRVHTGEVQNAAVLDDSCPIMEHHGYPPKAFDCEGDVVMEIEDNSGGVCGGADDVVVPT
nr:uncharacterized protein LOC109158503 [Ipomoea batatas]